MKSQIHPMIEGEKFTHLKRTREIFSNGIFISPRSKYITDLLKMLKLENCNPAPTPYVHSDVKEGGKLSDSNTKLFRAGVGVALYLGYGRTDIQFAIRELTKDMKDPNDGSMAKLHRLARYLQGTKDYGIWLERRGDITTLVVHPDTDWANCKKTRKSCACAMFSVGGCLLYSYARSLQMLCLSSGEAEFNGGVAACAEGLFLKEIFMFAGHPIKMEVYLDSSAARGVFQRQGVGQIRHLEVKGLWVQEALQRKLFTLHAVPSSDNTADFGTKALTIERFHKLRAMLKIGNYDEVIQKEKGNVNVVSAAGQFSKKAMIAALIMMLQQAEGAREADEPNTENGTLSQWIFVDLAVAFGWVLLIQAIMLAGFLWLVGKINGGLSIRPGKTTETKEVAVQAEWMPERWSKVFHLEGRDIFHVDCTCPRLAQRTRNFDVLRLCKSCPPEGYA